jgi:hypothetical protein
MTCPKCGQRIAVTNTEERENGVVLRRRQCRNLKCRLVIKTREAVAPEPEENVIKL